MRLTCEQLLRMAPGAYRPNVAALVRDFNAWGGEFGFTSRLRVAHFLAQVLHESGELRYTEELASGRAYEGRADLGNVREGDGVRFKGRGFLQLTGRANYEAYARSRWCRGDLMSHPEWLAASPGATKSALWFWWKNGLHALADKDDLKGITRKVNGGLNGLARRAHYCSMAKRVLGGG